MIPPASHVYNTARKPHCHLCPQSVCQSPSAVDASAGHAPPAFAAPRPCEFPRPLLAACCAAAALVPAAGCVYAAFKFMAWKRLGGAAIAQQG
eukprot:4386443-Pleurochrysis_carterae.AAC.2